MVDSVKVETKVSRVAHKADSFLDKLIAHPVVCPPHFPNLSGQILCDKDVFALVCEAILLLGSRQNWTLTLHAHVASALALLIYFE